MQIPIARAATGATYPFVNIRIFRVPSVPNATRVLVCACVFSFSTFSFLFSHLIVAATLILISYKIILRKHTAGILFSSTRVEFSLFPPFSSSFRSFFHEDKFNSRLDSTRRDERG